MKVRSHFAALFGVFLLLTFTSCAFVPRNMKYSGPAVRPVSLDQYYSDDAGYTAVSEEVIEEKSAYTHKKIIIDSSAGQTVIDYYQRPVRDENLIFVLPILGGKNFIEAHFARYFASRGYDTAIVNRNGDFKKPENFYRLEPILRDSVVRDRLAMDFFEKEYGKKTFGSFGISRGAINAAITAGVDPRLKNNVLVMGGSHLPDILRKTKQRGLEKYRERVMTANNISLNQLHFFLEENIKTDPRAVAKYIDARDTLMFIGVFDDIVPAKYGMRLRRLIGRPDTVFLPTGHFTGVAYTQVVPLLLPNEDYCLFPLDYIETQSLMFYDRTFHKKGLRLKAVPLMLLQLPIKLVGSLYDAIFTSSEND